METLITARLILREWTPEDAEALLAIAGNQNVAAGLGQKPLVSREEAAALINRYRGSGDVWALEHRLRHRVIGMVGLTDDALCRGGGHRQMLTAALVEEHWGSGYADEAVKTLLKHVFHATAQDIVTACHSSENNGFKRVLEKSGFICEGTLRRALRLWNGEVRDAVCWSILREEFEKLPVTRKTGRSALR